MGTLTTLLLQLREAQDMLGDAVATLIETPSLREPCLPLSRRLLRVIRELQQLESSAQEFASSAEQQKLA